MRYQEFSEREVLRPGMVRLSFTYFMSWDAIEFVVKGIELVARCGWKLLPQVIKLYFRHNYLKFFFSIGLILDLVPFGIIRITRSPRGSGSLPLSSRIKLLPL